MYKVIPFSKAVMSQKRSMMMMYETGLSNLIPFHKIQTIVSPPSSLYPEPMETVARPWYRHCHQIHQLQVLQGNQYIELYSTYEKRKLHFILTPQQLFKENELYYDCPCLFTILNGVYFRMINYVSENNLNPHHSSNMYDVNTIRNEVFLLNA